jgi:hypothetical protein
MKSTYIVKQVAIPRGTEQELPNQKGWDGAIALSLITGESRWTISAWL